MPVVLPGGYHSPYSRTIAELMARQGDIQARGAEASGQIWGGAVQNLGQIAGQAVQQHQEEQAIKRRDLALDEFVQSGIWAKDPQAGFVAAVKILGPVQGPKFYEGLSGASKMMNAQSPEEARKALPMVARGLLSAPAGSQPKMYDHARQMIVAAGLAKPEDLPEWGPEVLPYVQTLAQEGQPNQSAPPRETVNGQVFERTPQGAWSPAAGLPTATPKPEKAGSIEQQYLDAVQRGDTVEAQRLLGAHKQFREAGVTVRVGSGDTSAQDAKDVVAGMKDGLIPPIPPGRATKDYMRVAAEAKRQGYDLEAANRDWIATTKHLATLNGAQQTRLRQAVDTATHSLDVIEDLSKQWDGGKFPALNKAQLAAAKNGILGPKAQAIATQLEAQISDVTSELGNVYMGGNSPTDHALQLAAKNLSADWSQTQLKAALDLSRKNLKIRANSMVNVGVAGASEGNPYAAAPVAPAGGIDPEVQKRLDRWKTGGQ